MTETRQISVKCPFKSRQSNTSSKTSSRKRESRSSAGSGASAPAATNKRSGQAKVALQKALRASRALSNYCTRDAFSRRAPMMQATKRKFSRLSKTDRAPKYLGLPQRCMRLIPRLSTLRWSSQLSSLKKPMKSMPVLLIQKSAAKWPIKFLPSRKYQHMKSLKRRPKVSRSQELRQ